MTLFARCYLLVFCQLGMGGLLALAVPPFNKLERGYYKSSGGVFFSMALVGGFGTVYLHLTRDASGVGSLEAILWGLTVPLYGLYLSTLWGEAMVARARLFVATLALGFLALSLGAWSLAEPHGTVFSLLAVVDAIAAALVLGSVTAGMLIGHWYLIDTSMEIDPFHRCFGYFAGTLRFEVLALAVTLAVLWVWPPELDGSSIGEHAGLIAARLVLGPVAALCIAELIRRVLAIPQTMAATGLFYIATLAVLVGEFLGRYFTYRTRLPF